jgi:hypothetical protein
MSEIPYDIMEMSDMTLDVPVSPATFEVDSPPGREVIDMRDEQRNFHHPDRHPRPRWWWRLRWKR